MIREVSYVCWWTVKVGENSISMVGFSFIFRMYACTKFHGSSPYSI